MAERKSTRCTLSSVDSAAAAVLKARLQFPVLAGAWPPFSKIGDVRVLDKDSTNCCCGHLLLRVLSNGTTLSPCEVLRPAKWSPAAAS